MVMAKAAGNGGGSGGEASAGEAGDGGSDDEDDDDDEEPELDFFPSLMFCLLFALLLIDAGLIDSLQHCKWPTFCAFVAFVLDDGDRLYGHHITLVNYNASGGDKKGPNNFWEERGAAECRFPLQRDGHYIAISSTT